MFRLPVYQSCVSKCVSPILIFNLAMGAWRWPSKFNVFIA